MSVSLTQEQIADLNSLKDLHDEIEQEINRAESAGIDVTELRARLVAVENARTGILRVYGPEQSKRRRVS